MTLLERYRAAKACWQLAKHVTPSLKTRVAELMASVEPSGNSGEWKRHQVYAQLIKEFPAIPKHQLAFVIEVCKCFG
jgi:hypothetical protein